MKILKQKYPIGSFRGQKTPGRYIDETLYSNFEILAKKIVDDMTFLLFIFSSSLEVGTGKSTFVSQLGEAWTELVNKHHKLNIPFDLNNCVFKPKDLIEKSFKVPKYSFIWLDEWEDTHYWSELGMSLRQFFRKCRQLNLCMVCIIPNFFQLPINYAISRSVAAIDVKFASGFERGFFSFYNFEAKKNLYIKGKKTQDYSVVNPTFSGRFVDGYAVDEAKYRELKRKDMIDSEKETKAPIDKKIIIRMFRQLHKNLPEISIKRLGEGFGISDRTASRYLSDEYAEKEGVSQPEDAIEPQNNNYLIKDNEDNEDDDGDNETTKQSQ